MGGNLLKIWGLPEKRLNKADYEKMSELVLQKFSSWSGRAKVLTSYRLKESFGDLDCLVESHPKEDLRGFIVRNFDYVPHTNGRTHSFPIDGFQIDISQICPADFDSSYFYYTGEAGNLEGRVAHKLGLKWGHRGLEYTIRDSLFSGPGNNVLSEFVLTKDPKEACEIMGFDFERRNLGFDTPKDLYDYVIDSKYFNPSLFSYENLNHTNKTRNRKRKIYAEFLEYLETKTFDNLYQFKPKSEYLNEWKERFPALVVEINRQQRLYEMRQEIRGKFNGELVREWTGETEGKKIGALMRRLREEVGDTALFLLTKDEIEAKLKSYGNNEILLNN